MVKGSTFQVNVRSFKFTPRSGSIHIPVDIGPSVNLMSLHLQLKLKVHDTQLTFLCVDKLAIGSISESGAVSKVSGRS